MIFKNIFVGLFILIFLNTEAQPTNHPLELRAQFNGQYDFTVIGNTLSLYDISSSQCQLLTSSSATLNLQTNQSIEAAYLYWSSVGDGTFNSTVELNNMPITPEEILVVDPEQTNFLTYFGAVANVTNILQNFGNSVYTFSGLDLNSVIPPYCTFGLEYGGWAITIIYQQNNLPFKQVNVYDGLISVFGSGINSSGNLNINNFEVNSNNDFNLGILAFNGSPTLFFGESLKFNGNILSNPPLNPPDNPFNGTNSYTGDTDLYNMDIDLFDVSQYVSMGDTSANVSFESGRLRLLQNVNISLPNQLPEPTVSISPNQNVFCESENITATVEVFNTNATAPLPASTPVDVFYEDDNGDLVLLQSFYTTNPIPIDGSTSFPLDFPIPADASMPLQITAKVNELSDGTNPVNENNPDNNTFSLSIDIVQPPQINTSPNSLSVCGNISTGESIDLTQNNLAALGLSNPVDLNIQYFTSNSDAQNAINPISDPANFSLNTDPQTIFIRIENTDTPACFSVESFSISYEDTPEIQQTINLHQCQQDNTTITFDLTSNNASAIGVADPGNTNISYHETLTEAQNDVNAIADPADYSPLNNSQTLYVRAENADNADCFSTAAFTVHTFTAIINELDDLDQEACLALDQPAVFDLTQNSSLALGGQAAQDYSISYHLSQADAQNGNDPITDPSAFESSAPSQTIWLRLVNDNAPISCSSVASFDIMVDEFAVINNVNDLNIQACIFPGESATFDLTENSSIAIGQQDAANFDISYHISEADADNGVNAIEEPTDYENLSDPQMVWLRLENTNVATVCYAVEAFSIEVFDASVVNFSPSPLQTCDIDEDGFAAFDLNQSIPDITFNNPDIAVSFHLSLDAAENNTNPLSSPFTNTVTDNQTIFFRTEEAGNGCSFTGSLDLEVLTNPILDDSRPTISECAVDGDTATFNLTDINDAIILNDDTADLQIDHFLSENDALNNVNVISDPSDFSNTSNPQTLWFRVSDDQSCSSIAAFELEVLTGAAIADDPPDSLEICSENTDELSAVVDLTQLDAAINANPDEPTLVEYFTSSLDEENDNPIANPESFPVNDASTTIFARVIQVETLCQSEVIPIDININPLPQVDLSAFDGQVICIDAADGEVIDNDFSPPIIETGLADSDLSLSWQRNGEDLEVSSSSLTVDQPGEYSVVVTDNATGCQASSSVEILESSIPDFDVNLITDPFSRNPIVEISNIVGIGDFEFQLDDGNWFSLGDAQTWRFSDFDFGEHQITGRSILGCGERSKSFQVIGYRSFFTPDQDGYNDRWNISSLKNQSDAMILIYDRYGKLLKQLRPTDNGWDGTYNGNPMPSNDYWFSVKYTDPRTGKKQVFRGNLTLKR